MKLQRGKRLKAERLWAQTTEQPQSGRDLKILDQAPTEGQSDGLQYSWTDQQKTNQQI